MTGTVALGLVAAETQPDEEPQADQESEEENRALFTVVGLVVCAAIAFGLVMLGIAIDPGRVDVGKEPGVFELLVANRTTLTVLRFGLLCLVAYLAWSVAVLIKDRPTVILRGTAMATAQTTPERHLGEVAADVEHSRKVLEDSRRERLELEAKLRSTRAQLDRRYRWFRPWRLRLRP